MFTSSSTTGQTPAKHYVADLSIYERAFTLAFERFTDRSTVWRYSLCCRVIWSAKVRR
ncbi:MAG: hypothetical protein ACLTTP_02640 [Alistipes ihumii]